MTRMNFNCGEFKPGQEPSNPGSVSSIIPIVVVGTSTEPVDPPGINKPQYYKCVEKQILCPEGTRAVGPLVVPGVPNIKQIVRSCVKCGPTDTDPFCVARTSLIQCQLKCKDSLVNECIRDPEIPNRPGGGNTGGPGGGSTGGPTSGTPQPPNTGPTTGGGTGNPVRGPIPGVGPTTGPGSGEKRYGCVITGFTWCRGNSQLGGGFIESIARSCVECYRDFTGTYRPPPSTIVLPPNNQGLNNNNINCNFITLASCQTTCRPRTFTCPPVVTGPITQPPGVANPGGNNEPEPSGINTAGQQTGNITIQVSGSTSGMVNVGTQIGVVEIKEPPGGFNAGSTSVFDPSYNLVTYPYEPNARLRSSSPNNNNNVIKSKVPIHVANINNKSKSRLPWSEYDFQLVKDEEIKNTIPLGLLEAFTKLQGIDKQVIPYSEFLKMYKKHLFEGTLDEIDPNFYINLSKSSKPFMFSMTTDSSLRERAALGYIKSDAIVVDTKREENVNQKRRTRRSKGLLKDLDSTVDVIGLDIELKKVEMLNEGVFVTRLDDSKALVKAGEGDGYYLRGKACKDNQDKQIALSTDASSAYFQSPQTRDTSLTLLKKKPYYRISVEVENNTEFDVPLDQLQTQSIPVMFFMLDLSTVGDVVNAEDMMSETSAIYTLEDDLKKINDFLRSNGNSITRLNLDYRDPIMAYMRDTSSMNFTQKDLTFRNSLSEKSIDEFKLLRNIPFGFVVVPGMGSRHNPFNARSNLDEVTPHVVRSMTLVANGMTMESSLEERFLLEQEGIAKIGIVEESDAQNLVFYYDPSSPLYMNTYYKDGNYSSEQPTLEPSFEAKIVSIIEDDIKTNYNVTSITSWDLFRRFTPDIAGAYYYNYPTTLMDSIREGWRGVEMKNVVTKDFKNPSTLIPEHKITETEDSVILHEKDRIA